MIYLYYNPQSQTYSLATKIDMEQKLKAEVVSIVEEFDAGSRRIADNVCKNLNLARFWI